MHLKSIIQAIEDTFQVHIHGTVNINKSIENVQYLTSQTSATTLFQSETLYVGNYEDFHNFTIDACILLINCSSNMVNQKGLFISQPLDIHAVCNCIQQNLFESYKTTVQKETMFQALQAGYGIQSIIDIARTYLKNPISICTTSFSVLAVSPKNNNDDKFDLYNGNYYLRNNFLQNMSTNKVLNHIFAYSYPMITSFQDDPDMLYMFCSIHIKHAAVGYICIRSSIRPFTKGDSTFIVELSKILSIEMQKDNFYSNKSGLKYEYFLTDLIEQNLHNAEFATKRLTELGQTFYEHFWIMAFAFDDSSTNYINPNYYIDQLLGIFKHSMAFYYKGTLILLLSSNNINPFEQINKKKFDDFLQLNQMYAAISFRFETIIETPHYYEQVMFLLKNKNCTKTNRLIMYEDNYLYHLLASNQSSIDPITLIHPDILFLKNYDLQHHTDYISTLRAYFLCNRNANATAQYLHIHKSTFFYRVGKISDLINFDMNNPKLLFLYESSFYITDYL